MANIESLMQDEKHFLYLVSANGDGSIPHFNENDILYLENSDVSGLLWLPVSRLYMRSDRLRPKGQPALVSTPEYPLGIEAGFPTASIHEIAKTYMQHDSFNSEPVLCHLEQVPEFQKEILLVYEGRHRAVAAAMVDRPFILSRLIGPDYPSVISQHSPKNAKYFNKPIFNVHQIVEKYKNDSTV